MTDLSTTYLGLALKNPIIVGSSGQTSSVEKIKEFEKNGAGAVVLKSLLEEQIEYDVEHTISKQSAHSEFPETFEYIKNYVAQNSIETYLQLIRDCKATVKIPIIASINCNHTGEWVKTAKQIEEAGADALELNIFILPAHGSVTGAEYEQMYFDIIKAVKEQISIPLAVKTGFYFSSLVNMMKQLSAAGIQGLTLFNRFFVPDIDIHNQVLQPTNVFSRPEELYHTLRWVALLSDEVKCNVSASSGIHDAESIIKVLLAGATTTQLTSAIYINGPEWITYSLDVLSSWMKEHNYSKIDEFRGKLSAKNIENAEQYYRAQFIKNHTGIV